MNEEKSQGNPEAVDNAVFGSNADNFFESLDQDVNGLVQDEEVTPKAEAQVTPQGDSRVAEANVTNGAQNSEIDNLKKRYSDSSREAQNLKAQLNELQPFMPVLDAMKSDSGLVSHVRDYFNEGGNIPKDVKSKLKLDEDFQFDPDDMVNNADSDSRKVFDSMVGNIVNQRVGEAMNGIEEENQYAAYQDSVNEHAKDFIKRNGLTPDEFGAFIHEARDRFNERGMTFDDMYAVMNQGKVSQNVANATKTDMLNQMKNVRNIPTSQGASNNAGKPNSQTDNVFDALLKSDGNIEELLG